MENTYKIIEQVCYHALLYLAAYFAPIKESTIIILVLIILKQEISISLMKVLSILLMESYLVNGVTLLIELFNSLTNHLMVN